MKAQRGQYLLSGGPGSLQMVLELDIGRRVSLLAVPQRGVNTRRCASKDARSERRVDLEGSHID